MVLAVLLEDGNAVMLQCVFVTGSDAIGCLVVLQLVGEADNTIVRLTRKGMHKCAMKSVTLTNSSSQISKILSYDIESNGSIGTLPVSGELSWNVSLLNCKSSDKVEEDTQSKYCSIPGICTRKVVVMVTAFKTSTA